MCLGTSDASGCPVGIRAAQANTSASPPSPRNAPFQKSSAASIVRQTSDHAVADAAVYADVHIVSAGRKPRDAADAVLFRVTRHCGAKTSEPASIEATHAGKTP